MKYTYSQVLRIAGFNKADINGIANEIINRYSTSYRYYHDNSHILNMLNLRKLHFEDVNNESNGMVDFAILMHDIVYYTNEFADRSEHDSAEYALNLLDSHSRANSADKQLAWDIIQGTKHHLKSYNKYVNIVSDLDMSAFSKSQAGMMLDVMKLRHEYLDTSNTDMVNNRILFLEDLLTRDIFHTEVGKYLWEKKSRDNIKFQIKLMTVIKDQGLGLLFDVS